MGPGKEKIIVFIGFGESLSAPEVAWDLLDNGFQVMAFCRRGSFPPLRYIKEVKLVEVTPPETNTWEAVEQIGKSCRLSSVRVLMPLDDASIWLCNQVSIQYDIIVAGATGDNARLALNKRYQLETAGEAGFNVLETVYINERPDLLKNLPIPAVIKPADAVLEIKGKLLKGPIVFCVEKEDMVRAAHELTYEGPMMVQPFLPGIGEGIFGLNTPDGVRQWSAHRRIRTVNPLGSGSSACRSLPISDHPLRPAEKMLKKANWPGMFMIELLRDTTNRIWFMELNGRSWGSMALALRLGFHYPVWTVCQRLDPSFSPPEPPPWQPVVCRHLGREIIHVLSVLKNKKTFRLIPNYSRLRTLWDICRINKETKWYNRRKGYSFLFWNDALETVRKKLFSGRGSH